MTSNKILFFVFLLTSPTAWGTSDLAELITTHTLVKTQTITYSIERDSTEVEQYESELFIPMSSDEDCEHFDTEHKFEGYKLITVENKIDKDLQTNPSWVEGYRIEGRVASKTTQLCFATLK